MRSYWRLFRYLKPHLGVLGIAIGCMVGTTLFEGVQIGAIVPLADRIFSQQAIVVSPSAAVPEFIRMLIDMINAMDPRVLLKLLLLLVPCALVAKGLTLFLQQYFMNDASQRVITDLRQALFDKCTTLPAGFFDDKSTGMLVSRATYDVGMIQNSITEGAVDLVYQPLRILLYATIAFTIQWQWALAIVGVLVVVAYPIQRLGKALKKLSHRSQETVGDLNTTLYETYSGMPIVQAYGMEQAASQRFLGQNRNYYKLQLKMIKRREILAPLTEVLALVALIPVLWYGGLQVLAGFMSSGVFLMFAMSMLMLIHPIKRVSRVNGVIQQAIAAADRVFDILDEPMTIADAPAAQALPAFREQIRYENVSFEYNASTPVLQDINLTITRGDVVAFVGASGVGKTTLVNLLPRFYDPTKGRITIDGQDVRDVTLASLRQQIAIVTQDTVLFNDTLRHNIAWGRPGASLAEIQRAATAAHAHGFIATLPATYDTVIGEGGGLLSGGQRQRVALARAFLRDAPMIILDEATSQLDAESEHLINEAVDRLMRGRTVLLIAHRLSTVRHAQRIVVMHEGRIVDEGTHEELILKNPLYRRVAALQFVDSLPPEGVAHTA